MGLFFILVTQNAFAMNNDLNEPLFTAQQLLSENKYDQAFILFEQHAKNNNPLAQMTLGLFYKLGWGDVKQDNSQACQWFYQAAIAEIPQAQKEFADCIHFDNFEPLTTSKFTESEALPSYWYNKAYQNGLHNAGCDIGRLYLGTKWQQKNIKKAIEWCIPAAERSVVAAQITLGDIFVLSTSFQNVGSAEYWYQQAVLQNSGQAAFKLANLYYSIALNKENKSDFMDKALLMMEKSSSLKYAPSYEKTASIYWTKLAVVEKDIASSVLAKSYLWAKTAYQVNPTKENLSFLNIILDEMPSAWQEELDEQVKTFLK